MQQQQEEEEEEDAGSSRRMLDFRLFLFRFFLKLLCEKQKCRAHVTCHITAQP
jgi:cell division protein FtsB